MATTYLLFELASGYALFERLGSEEIGEELKEVQNATDDFSRFSKLIRFHSFLPFPSAESALENINAISEGAMHDHLKNFLEMNLPKGKKNKVQLAVQDEKLGGVISEGLNVSCVKNKMLLELFRGLRLHFPKFMKELKEGDYEKAQLGLGHSYSRCKVKFNVNRADNMIIQSICLLDTLDKDFNTFAMRVKEWYSWHFPELSKIVPDNATYARLVKFIKNKSALTESHIDGLDEITMDSGKAREIFEAAKSSMGTDISDLDMLNIEKFADRVIHLAEYKKQLQDYLSKKMHDVAPNLAGLVGDHVGARLISHAGSLTNLAKYPASTVQILGAEKALFRALKTRGNTPKYGLIFHSTFISRAGTKNKGRISRYLANKCSLASRIDAFSEVPTAKFGQKLNEQVEERLRFYETGALPRKNIDVMKQALLEVQSELETAGTPSKKRKKPEKEKEAEAKNEAKSEGKQKKKKKGSKVAAPPAPKDKESPAKTETTSEGKKKKKKKKSKGGDSNSNTESEKMEVETKPAASEEKKTKKKPKKKKKKAE